MAPKHMDMGNFTSSDLDFMKHVAADPEKHEGDFKNMKSGLKLKYRQSYSLFDLVTRKSTSESKADILDRVKRATVGGAALPEEFNNKTCHKPGYSKLVHCWKRIKRSLSSKKPGRSRYFLLRNDIILMNFYLDHFCTFLLRF